MTDQPTATAALTVSQVNALLGIDVWHVRSFRANVQIDFDEFGNVLSVTLLNPATGRPAMEPDTAAPDRPKLPAVERWDAMLREDRIAIAKAYLADAVEHQAETSPGLSIRVEQGIRALKEALSNGC